MRFDIEFSPETIDHLRALTARQRSRVLDRIDAHLEFEPLVETRNRKLMRPNQLALWELRIGDLRVYYDVELDPQPTVFIRAVGIKEGDRVRIGREVFRL